MDSYFTEGPRELPTKIQVAYKNYRCSDCDRIIYKGEYYKRFPFRFRDSFYYEALCVNCDIRRKALQSEYKFDKPACYNEKPGKPFDLARFIEYIDNNELIDYE